MVQIVNAVGTSYNDEALSVSVELANQSDWQTPMMAAPMCVLLIAKCMAMMVGSYDLSLESCRPPNGFKHLTQPNSLRASLRQLCEETFEAMSTAEGNMKKISLASNGIPVHIRSLYDSLTLGTPEEKRRVVPFHATVVRNEAAKCAAWGEEICKQFRDTKAFLNELLLCCEARKGSSELEARKNAARKQRYDEYVVNNERDLATEQQRIEENLAERKKIERDLQKLSKVSTLEKFVHGAELVALSTAKVARVLVAGLAPQDSGNLPPRMMHGPVRIDEPLPGIERSELDGIDANYANLLQYSPAEPEAHKIAQDLLGFLGSFTERIFQSMLTYPRAVCDYATSNDIHRESRLAALEKSREAARSLLEEFRELVSRNDDVRTQNQAGAAQAKMNLQTAKNRRQKLHSTAKILADANAQKALIEQRIAAVNSKRRLILSKLADIQTSACTIEDTIKMLKRVLEQLNDLQIQWNKMVLFFNATAATMGQASTEVETVATLIESVHTMPSLTNSLNDNIIQSCIQAQGRSKYMNLISTMYVDVSKEFITNDLVTLPLIMSMTPGDAQAEVESRQKRLDQTHSGIEKLVAQKHRGMIAFMTKHAEEGKKLYLAAAPASSNSLVEEDVRAIEIQVMQEASAVTTDAQQREMEDCMAKLRYTEGDDNAFF